MDCPTSVEDRKIIRGRVVDSRWNVYILVHPFKVPEWWVQQIAVPDQTGIWHGNAIFGGLRGDSFQIVAIGSPANDLFKEGETIYPHQISEDIVKTKICEVIKK